ncbi:unnamed protein product, partial [Rotaria sp. Silwood2]
MLSSSVDGDKIIIKKDLNIGMATALPSGNLIVPVIKNADQLNLTGLTKQVNGLANAARNGKLKPDDTTGGTFTLTNVGTFGSIMGTPIINQPQVAIMAVGAIKKRPMVIETPQGDSIAIRHMMKFLFFQKLVFKQIALSLDENIKIVITKTSEDEKPKISFAFLENDLEIETFDYSNKLETDFERNIQRFLPIRRITPDTWIDNRTDRILTLDDLLNEYADQLPDEISKNLLRIKSVK